MEEKKIEPLKEVLEEKKKDVYEKEKHKEWRIKMWRRW